MKESNDGLSPNARTTDTVSQLAGGWGENEWNNMSKYSLPVHR